MVVVGKLIWVETAGVAFGSQFVRILWRLLPLLVHFSSGVRFCERFDSWAARRLYVRGDLNICVCRHSGVILFGRYDFEI